MSTRKPIRVFFGPLSNTFYATQHYRATDLGDGTADCVYRGKREEEQVA